MLSLGLGIVVAALYVLATRGPAPPEEEIDAASRARLERLLREATEDAP